MWVTAPANGARYLVATAHYLPDGRNPHREQAAVVVGATLEYLAQVTDRPIADWLSDVVSLGDHRTLYEDQPDRISGLLPVYLLGDLIKRPPVHAAAVHAAVYISLSGALTLLVTCSQARHPIG